MLHLLLHGGSKIGQCKKKNQKETSARGTETTESRFPVLRTEWTESSRRGSAEAWRNLAQWRCADTSGGSKRFLSSNSCIYGKRVTGDVAVFNVDIMSKQSKHNFAPLTRFELGSQA